MTPNVLGGGSFLEIKADGELWTWSQQDSTYVGTKFLDGRDATRLITGLDTYHFVDVWHDNGNGYDELLDWVNPNPGLLPGWTANLVDYGWSNARLITGLDNNNFLEIKTDGELWNWHWNGMGYDYTGKWVMGGWGDTRLIAGLADNDFMEVKGDELFEWIDNGSGWQSYPRMGGWSDARLIAGISRSTFVEVKATGELWQWTWNGGYNGTRIMYGWNDARLLG